MFYLGIILYILHTEKDNDRAKTRVNFLCYYGIVWGIVDIILTTVYSSSS